MTASEFYSALKGKRVSFIGVGRTNLPLIEKFIACGAAVTVRDKREAEALGEDGAYLKGRGAALFFSRRTQTNGAWCSESGEIFFGDTPVLRESDILIPGKHNVENYLAAISAVWGDVPAETIVSVAGTFGGVEHRMELVRTLDGVRWYNDSIATSPSRAMTGTLSLYDFKIVMIAGGADKKVPFDELGAVICDKVSTLVLLAPEKPLPGFKPAAAEKIEAAVRGAANYSAGAPEILHACTMEEAVALAKSRAVPGGVVSLCPAATGFDMYKSFAERGDIFRAVVQGL